MTKKMLNDFTSSEEYIQYYRQNPEELWNLQATRSERIISALENSECAICGEKLTVKFHSFVPDRIDREFGAEQYHGYSGACKNGHGLEISADASGCITE